MKNIKFTAAALALITAVIFSPSAKAAAAAGDLVLGMYDSSGTVSDSYEIDLGTIGSLSPGETWNLDSDISTAFAGTTLGSNLEWNISASGGTFGGAGGLAGAKEIALTIPTTSTLNNVSATTTPSGDIVSMDSAYLAGLLIPADKVANSTDGGVVLANSVSTSFYTEGVAAPKASFGLSNSITGGDLALYSSTADLYTITNATHGVETELGAFSFDTSTGVLNYAVPEPSTYALMGVGLLAFGWILKRRASSMV